jgi:hypothetical protein
MAMTHPIRSIGSLALLLLVVAGCGGADPGPDDPDGGDGGDDPTTTVAPTTTGGDGEALPLTETWGCGHGFWMSDAGQTLALLIQANGIEPGAIEVGVPVTLPDPAWNVKVLYGRDLFANWCDDVIEPGEPEPLTFSEISLDSGTITPVVIPEDGGVGVASIEVSGLRTEGPDGPVVVADMTIDNPQWGMFAG